MLILGRRVGEKILIGKQGDILLEIVGYHGNRVNIGFIAPRHIPIHREEIFYQLQPSCSPNYLL